MTLARRLALALGAILVLLVLSGATVVLRQRDYALDQLDQRLAALSNNPRLMGLAGVGPQGGGTGSEEVAGVVGDVYVGLLEPTGRLRTLQAPAEDPEMVPDVSGLVAPTGPTGRPTVSGDADQVRVAVTRLRGRAGGTAVIAIPTTDADAATRRLMGTLGAAGLALAAALALIVTWVHRLGLAPIARMTATAEAIANGSGDRRWAPDPPGTEAHRLGQALNAMLAAEQAVQDRMRRFVADASHELRTPLTTLRGYSTLYGGQVGEQPAAVEDALRRINDEARRMGGIVEGLLDLNDLDEHGVLDLQPVDLVPLLQGVLADLQVVAPGRRLGLTAPERLPARADADRVTQAVLSLATNAVRHTPEGTPVQIRAFSADGRVRVEVVDAGPGIPVEHLPHLFDRFYRADPSRARASGGNGLGLAIVAAIATAHGGRYGVDSAPGHGSVFWIDLTEA